MGNQNPSQTETFINTVSAIADIREGNPGATSLSDLMDVLTNDFGVIVKSRTEDADVFKSRDAAFTLTEGLGGDDFILGRSGTDAIFGGLGNDRLFGLDGNDALFGEEGADRLFGGSGDDLLRGGEGDDVLKGGLDNDDLKGGIGNDWLLGQHGDDFLYGGMGEDFMFGGDGNDFIGRSQGNDYINGGAGNDTLEGGAGRDIIVGGEGDDLITGGDGNDILVGGAGADTFFWEVGFSEGRDVVTDFELGSDKILFRLQSILDTAPSVADAVSKGQDLGEALDDSELWMITEAGDGSLLISAPEFEIKFLGIEYDSSITFDMLEDMGAFDTF